MRLRLNIKPLGKGHCTKNRCNPPRRPPRKTLAARLKRVKRVFNFGSRCGFRLDKFDQTLECTLAGL